MTMHLLWWVGWIGRCKWPQLVVHLIIVLLAALGSTLLWHILSLLQFADMIGSAFYQQAKCWRIFTNLKDTCTLSMKGSDPIPQKSKVRLSFIHRWRICRTFTTLLAVRERRPAFGLGALRMDPEWWQIGVVFLSMSAFMQWILDDIDTSHEKSELYMLSLKPIDEQNMKQLLWGRTDHRDWFVGVRAARIVMMNSLP